jgi:uncharacterized protein (DUF58 family)
VKLLNFIASLLVHPYRRLYLTARGWIFCAITVGMGLVAMNTGHNLFHLMFGFLISAVLVSGILSEMVLRGVTVQRDIPDEVTARIPFPVLLRIHNSRRSRSVYAVQVSDSGDFFPPRKLGYITALRPGERKHISYFAQVEKRGSYRLRWVRLSTRFPFGLFEKVRLVPLDATFVACPGPCEIPELKSLLRGNDHSGSKKHRTGEEVLSLRPALPDDDHRLIHWRTSARSGQLMVKEMAERNQQPRLLFFDNRGAEGDRFERAVEIAANLLRLLVKNGVPVSFATWEEQFQPATNGAQGKEIGAALRHLGLITPTTGQRQNGFHAWCAQAARAEGGLFLQIELEPPRPLPRCEILLV